MDSWERVKELFGRAVEIAEDEREAWLERECGGDAALRAEVAGLLAADVAGDRAIDQLVDGALVGLTAAGDGSVIGRRLGSWRIVSELGRGGMGTVFLAERADDAFRGEAAIKLIRGAGYDRELERRFLSERQILAGLRHPNIARLLDGGATEDGLPYLVMEHVEGQPIDVYCDAAGLGLRRRVALVREVCRAVEHAHQRLVVHRDLKPSNILVTAEGRPKLLDFGIAKLLDPNRVDHTVALTVEGQGRLTPEYAAPEQVRGEPVTTATDVWALGVLLYRLLTGVLPFRVTGVAASEIERAICDTEPVRPSTAAGRTATGAAAGEARIHGRRLRGDLDNIVLKALAKEPERRYATVRELDDDLGRFLDDRPVEARPSSRRYRAAKFVRRHRGPLTVVAVALAVVVAVVAVATVRLAHARDRAELEAATAGEVTDFLVRLFGQASPYVTRGDAPTAVDLLDQGARDVDELGDRPRLQAALLEVMGAAFSELGRHDQAVALLGRAVQVRRTLPDGDPLELASALDDYATACRVATRFDDAEAAAREALAIRRRRLGPAHHDIARSLNHLGLVMFQVGRLSEACDLQHQALAMFDALGEGDSAAAADAMNNLGIALDRRGDHRGAEAVHRRAVALNRRLLGLDHPNTAAGLSNLALALTSLGRYREAERLFRQSLEIRRRLFGDRQWRTALGASNLTRALVPLGEFDEAQSLLDEAIATTREVDGEEHLQYARRLRDLGDLELAQGRTEAAAASYRSSLELYRRLAGDDSRQADWMRIRLASARRAGDEAEEAAALVQEVLSRADGDTEDRRPVNAAARLELLSDQVALGRIDAADAVVQQVLAEWEEQFGADSARMAEALLPAAAVARAEARLPAAVELLGRAVELRRVALGGSDWLTAEAQLELGDTLLAAGRTEAARDQLEAAAASLSTAFGDADARVQRARRLLGTLPSGPASIAAAAERE